MVKCDMYKIYKCGIIKNSVKMFFLFPFYVCWSRLCKPTNNVLGLYQETFLSCFQQRVTINF